MRARMVGVGMVAALALAFGAPAAGASQTTAYQGDAGHTGAVSDSALDGPLHVAWTTDLGGPTSYPLVADGRVFVTVGNVRSYGGRLVALDAATGAVRWERTLGGTYFWSALTYGGGAVYAINFDGTLVAIDGATGATRWAEQLPGQYAFSSAPTYRDGVVYTGGAGTGGTLYAVDAQSGALRWTALVANGDESSPAVDGSGVYVSYACAYVFAFGLGGAPLWTTTPPCSGGGGRTAVLTGGRLYVRDGGSGTVYDTATGQLVDVFGSQSIPALAGNFGALVDDGVLTIVDKATLTTRAKVTGEEFSTAPFIVGTRVFAGTTDGRLIGVDAATAATKVSLDLGAPLAPPDEHNVSQPLTGLGAGGGVLVAPTADGRLHGITGAGGSTTAPSTPPATPPAPEPVAEDPAPVVGAPDTGGVGSGLAGVARPAPSLPGGTAAATATGTAPATLAAALPSAAERLTLPATARLTALTGAGLPVSVTRAHAGATLQASLRSAGRLVWSRTARVPANGRVRLKAPRLAVRRGAQLELRVTAPRTRTLLLKRTLR